MDNFFDYIVILFFIISAIASIFKKKKSEEAKRAAKAQDGSPVAKPQPLDRNNSDYQTYRKDTETTAPSPEYGSSGRTTEYQTGTREDEGDHQKSGYTFQEMKSEVEKYFEEAIAKSQLTEEPTPPPKPQPAPPVVEHKSDAVPESSFKESSIKDIHVEPVSTVNRRAEDIRKRIKNTTELQDLIVINEILNKPKALRKSSR